MYVVWEGAKKSAGEWWVNALLLRFCWLVQLLTAFQSCDESLQCLFVCKQLAALFAWALKHL